jgi:DNA-binding response OmpR family regulator
MNNEELRALCVPVDERPYQAGVDRLVERLYNTVIQAAKEGKTDISDFRIMMPDLPCQMICRQLRKKLSQAVIEYENSGDVKVFTVDWTN